MSPVRRLQSTRARTQMVEKEPDCKRERTERGRPSRLQLAAALLSWKWPRAHLLQKKLPLALYSPAEHAATRHHTQGSMSLKGIAYGCSEAQQCMRE
jgi:hypothetical protein